MLKNASIISCITLLSRIFGYIRDVLIASKLGAGIYNDLFLIALRIPNMFRSLFGEGAFTNAFVPIYSALLVKEGKKNADKFAMQMQSILFISVLLFSILLFILMPQVISIAVPGIEDEAYRELAVRYSRVTLPFLLLISLVAFYGGILNALGKYFAFAATPIFFNLILVACCFIPADQQHQLEYLSYTVVIAGAIELVWILIFFYLYGGSFKILSPQYNSKFITFMKRFWPIVIGSGVTQINLLVDTILASFIPHAISYLYYADRINQLPLALLGTAMGVALLPPLSKAYAQQDEGLAIKMHNRAIEWVLLFVLPAMVGILLLAHEIIFVLFEHANFTAAITYQTKNALMAFSIGLPALTLIKVFIANFYAHGDTKTPVKIAALCILSNLIFSLLLMPKMGHSGIALASSISAWINLTLLWYKLREKQWFALEKRLYKTFRNYSLGAVLMAVAILAAKFYIVHPVALLACSIIGGGGLYFLILIVSKRISRT